MHIFCSNTPIFVELEYGYYLANALFIQMSAQIKNICIFKIRK